MKSVVLAAVIFFVLTVSAFAQMFGELELKLKPEQIKDGMPEAFIFLLINKSNHDIRLPTPEVDCGNSYTGSIMLRVHFVPSRPDEDRVLHGCAADKYDWQEILERAKEWKVLRAGESLSMEAKVSRPGKSFGIKQGKFQVFLDDHAAGSYEFWADYEPPAISSGDKDALTAVGIDFPRGGLSSTHITFRKDQ